MSRQVTVLVARPDVRLVQVEGEIDDPALGGKQRHGLYLRHVRHPEVQRTVVTGRIDAVAVDFQLRDA